MSKMTSRPLGILFTGAASSGAGLGGGAAATFWLPLSAGGIWRGCRGFGPRGAEETCGLVRGAGVTAFGACRGAVGTDVDPAEERTEASLAEPWVAGTGTGCGT